MITYIGGRQSGKTTKAIKLAASTNRILIAPTISMARNTERLSRELGYPVQVISAEEFFSGRHRGSSQSATNVVIDELEMVLRSLFRVDVIAATSYGCTEEEITEGNE